MAKASRASRNTAQRVGERIRQFRKAAGMTQAQLAERADMEDMTVSRLETGARAPSLDQLERLARVFEVPIAHFLNEEDDPAFIRGREMAALLIPLSRDQQAFVMDFVRIYADAHSKKARSGPNKK